MNLLEMISKLFQVSDFTPHGFCLSWNPDLLTATIVSNLGIALAYYVIPIQLLIYRNTLMKNIHLSSLPHWVPLSFGSFIFMCGTSHLAKVLTLFYPFYWIETFIDSLTMIISFGTSIFFGLALAHVLRRIDKQPPQTSI